MTAYNEQSDVFNIIIILILTTNNMNVVKYSILLYIIYKCFEMPFPDWQALNSL
jgi:hypothetical protein